MPGSKQYPAVGLGGAFDHLHAGHQKFLKFSADLGAKVYVGVSTTELIQHKELASQIQPWSERSQAVKTFLSSLGVEFEVFALKDIYGPTIESDRVQAVAVTEQTQKGGQLINQARTDKGLAELPIHVCQMVHDESGEILSSTRIRQGLVDRHGHVYSQHIVNKILNETQRAFFAKPHGKMVKTVEEVKDSSLIVVGDICTEYFFDHDLPFTLGVIDGRSRRQPFVSKHVGKFNVVQTVTNPAGHLSEELVLALQAELPNIESDRRIIKVEGEEDLAAVAAVMLAPLGSRVIYGYPNQGMMEIEVTENQKTAFSEVFKR